MTSKEFGKLLQDKLTSEYGVELSVASNQQIYRSLALICRQMMSENHKKFQSKAIGTGTKQVYYLCMEFLMGRSLKMSLFNLGLDDLDKRNLHQYERSYACGDTSVCFILMFKRMKKSIVLSCKQERRWTFSSLASFIVPLFSRLHRGKHIL